MYGDLAWTWPIISPFEDYVEESELLSKAILENSRVAVGTLLHLGCGGGHNDRTFKKRFTVTGVDVSDAMLGLARGLNPEVTYLRGDMRTVRLGKLFDAVAILDSIGYMTTAEDLRAAFQTAFEHLKPGGVFLTLAEETPERFQQNRTRCSIHSEGEVEICFIENCRDMDPSDSTFEATFVWVIRRGGRLEIEVEHQMGGIFPLGIWVKLLGDTGFEVRQSKFEDLDLTGGGCPMFVCIKPE